MDGIKSDARGRAGTVGFGVACFLAGAMAYGGAGAVAGWRAGWVWAETGCAPGYHRDVHAVTKAALCRSAAFPTDSYAMGHEWRAAGPGVSAVAPSDPGLRPPT
jgi:hypothetical protein